MFKTSARIPDVNKLRTKAQNLGRWRLTYICREDALACRGSGLPREPQKPQRTRSHSPGPRVRRGTQGRFQGNGQKGVCFVSKKQMRLLTINVRTTCVQSPRVPVLAKSVAKNSRNQMCWNNSPFCISASYSSAFIVGQCIFSYSKLDIM